MSQVLGLIVFGLMILSLLVVFVIEFLSPSVIATFIAYLIIKKKYSREKRLIILAVVFMLVLVAWISIIFMLPKADI